MRVFNIINNAIVAVRYVRHFVYCKEQRAAAVHGFLCARVTSVGNLRRAIVMLVFPRKPSRTQL